MNKYNLFLVISFAVYGVANSAAAMDVAAAASPVPPAPIAPAPIPPAPIAPPPVAIPPIAIPPIELPPECGINEVYLPQGIAPNCDTLCSDIGLPCTNVFFQAPSGCYCVAGHARDVRNICVPLSECPMKCLIFQPRKI